MRKRTDLMQKQIEAQRGELAQLIAKRLELLRRQIDALDSRVRWLPAEQETAIRPQLAQLAQKRDEVWAKLTAFRDAAPDKSAESLRQLDAALDQFQKEYERIEAETDAPKGDAGK
jgi:DNA repair exonuclease SbcCD ATPase subunit